MNNRAVNKFWKYFERLPQAIQNQAEKNFELWKKNPRHPGLKFEQVHPVKPFYSIRVSQKYRALARKEGDTFFWFWVGTHNDYEKIIAQL